jgi:hypothetical protein
MMKVIPRKTSANKCHSHANEDQAGSKQHTFESVIFKVTGLHPVQDTVVVGDSGMS